MTDYYIDPANGSNNNSGTSVDDAWEDFRPIDPFDGSTSLAAGDTVYVRDTAEVTQEQVDLRGYAGESGDRIVVTNYENESPTIDVGSGSSHGVLLDNCQYVTFENHEVKNAWNHNIRITNSKVYDVRIHNVESHGHGQSGDFGAGLNIRNDADSVTVTNSEFYDGYAGGNSDGLIAADGAKNTVIKGTVCHHNPDDGVDLKGANPHDPNEPAELRQVVSYRNGSNLDGSSTGNGLGYKISNGNDGTPSGGGHKLVRCVAFENDNWGIGFPPADVPVTFWNCTFVRNKAHNIYLDSGTEHVYTNVVSQESDEEDNQLSGNEDVTTCNFDAKSGTFNSDVYVDFRSYDVSDSDDWLHLKEGSRGIDEGTDVGLSYSGDAPDWGRHEYDGTTSSGSAVLRVYTGSAWKKAPARYYDGDQFVSL